MSELFLNLVNISIMASWLIVIIIILRLAFKSLPKKTIRYLWLIVGLRLMLPFSIETDLSLIPSSNTIIIPYKFNPMINTGFETIDNNINLIIENNITNQIESSLIFHSYLQFVSIAWTIGILLIVLYLFFPC